MSQRAVAETRMAVAGFEWATYRVQRFHSLIGGFAVNTVRQGTDSGKVYDFVRAIGRELGETVSSGVMMHESAKKMREVVRRG